MAAAAAAARGPAGLCCRHGAAARVVVSLAARHPSPSPPLHPSPGSRMQPASSLNHSDPAALQPEQQSPSPSPPLPPPQSVSSSSSSSSNGSPPPESPAADDWCQRSRLLVGADGLQKLAAVNVLLVGLGGVGSFAAEFLCRAGVGSMTLVDGDTVDTTNRNRQLPALRSTVGMLKTEVVAQRLTDINPDLQLTLHQEFLDPVRAAALVREQDYSVVVDCIDSVAPKTALLLAGHAAGVPTISSMGAGGRLDPSRVRLADISETHNDSFAAVVRRRLRKAGVGSGIAVVFSDELAQPASLALTEQQYKRSYFGTSSYIPGLFGLFIASHIIRTVVEPGYRLPRPPAPPPPTRKQQQQQQSRRSKKRRQADVSTASSEGTRPASPPAPASPPQQQQQMFQSFQGVQGAGMGFDGEGL